MPTPEQEAQCPKDTHPDLPSPTDMGPPHSCPGSVCPTHVNIVSPPWAVPTRRPRVPAVTLGATSLPAAQRTWQHPGLHGQQAAATGAVLTRAMQPGAETPIPGQRSPAATPGLSTKGPSRRVSMCLSEQQTEAALSAEGRPRTGELRCAQARILRVGGTGSLLVLPGSRSVGLGTGDPSRSTDPHRVRSPL